MRPGVSRGFQVLVSSSEQLGLIAGQALLDGMCSQVDVLSTDHDGWASKASTQRGDIVDSLGFRSHLRAVSGQIQTTSGGQVQRNGRSSSGRGLGHRWLRGLRSGCGRRLLRGVSRRIDIRLDALGVRDLQCGSGLGRKSRRIESEGCAVVFESWHVWIGRGGNRDGGIRVAWNRYQGDLFQLRSFHDENRTLERASVALEGLALRHRGVSQDLHTDRGSPWESVLGSGDDLLLVDRWNGKDSCHGELGPIVCDCGEMSHWPGFVVVSMHRSDRCVESSKIDHHRAVPLDC